MLLETHFVVGMAMLPWVCRHVWLDVDSLHPELHFPPTVHPHSIQRLIHLQPQILQVLVLVLVPVQVLAR